MADDQTAAAILRDHLNRRTMLKGLTAVGLGSPLAMTLGRSGRSGRVAAQEGQRGGDLKVALLGELQTMDMPFTTANIVGSVIWSIFEPLFTYNDQFELIPMLAESHQVSEDKLTHTIALRQGVLFHNGQEMTSNDVVSSIQRWGRVSGFASNLMAATNEVVGVDEYTVEFRLNKPYGTLPHALAQNNGGCPIYPQAINEAAGDEQISEFVGTGPYRLVERQADRFIRLERFEEYSALSGESAGYGGHKYAYADTIEFIPVPDEAARVSGLQAGDYHYLQFVSPDQFGRMQGDSAILVEKMALPDYLKMATLNWLSPTTGNEMVRQAIQARLDCESILIAGLGQDFYRLDPGLMFQETVWHLTVGQENYNRNDPETARQLLAESGYDGTPLTLLCNREDQVDFNMGAATRQQLEEVGFTIDFQALDWATVLDRANTADQWDIWVVGYGFKPDPTQVPAFRMCTPNGGWCDDESAQLMDQLSTEADLEVRLATFEAIQQNFYAQAPLVKLGDSYGIQARAANLQGQMLHTALGITFWNMWFAE